jgi:hypothetical protein
MKIARAGQRLPSCRLDLPRAGPARGRDHRRSGGHLDPDPQAGYLSLSATITNQNDVVVLDGTAVVWRDPAVANG